MRVLILADDCNPEWPSLPVVGYNSIKAISEYIDVVVITHVRNRPNIELHGLGRARIEYIDNEYLASPLYKLSKLARGGTAKAWSMSVAFTYPSYLAFEREAFKIASERINRGDFDLVHRLTPMSPTIPSPMARWSTRPFVLGPINGGLSWPPHFQQELIREREWLTYFRQLYKILPYVNSTYNSSKAILTAFNHTLEDLPQTARKKSILFPEVGFDPNLFYPSNQKVPEQKKTFLFVGRLVPYKLPHLSVQAFADHSQLQNHKLVLVGDGPERTRIEKLIKVHRLHNNVELLGWKSQAEIATLMRIADVFVFPSIRELGAGVIVEAMACGLPCIVVDYGAPRTLIAGDRGIKVPLSNIEGITKSFGEAMCEIVDDQERITQMGLAASRHATQFYTWDVKAKAMLQVYNYVLGRGPKPTFYDQPEK